MDNRQTDQTDDNVLSRIAGYSSHHKKKKGGKEKRR